MSAKRTEQLCTTLGITPPQLKGLIDKAQTSRMSVIELIEHHKLIPVDKALKAFGSYYGVPVADFSQKNISREIIKIIPKELAQKLKVVPIDRVGNNVFVATSDPQNLKKIDQIRFKTGYFPKPVLASEEQIIDAIEKYYGKQMSMDAIDASTTSVTVSKKKTQKDAVERIDVGQADASDGAVVKIVNETLVTCKKFGASDIHVEPYEDFVRIRLRIDGTLHEIARPPLSIRDALISRIKIMGKMDIAEKRLPQDGAINIMIGNAPIDFRVNTLPTVYGEKIVMRILDKSALQVDMTQLGFEESELEKFKKSIHNPFGIVLVTGPTGSGKTTTLYSALQDLNREDVNLVTAEDPVEYNLMGINQVQMKSDIGLTFASALRAFLRQDPDIIMVGEIRDLETAEIAIKASLTGHLVLSTLHTNSAPDTVSRMLNMGVEAFNLVSACQCVVAQRLLRRICTNCKVVDEQTTPQVLVDLGVPEEQAQSIKAYKGKGCAKCGGTGMKGRVAIHEVMVFNDAIRECILRKESTIQLKKVAMQTGMKSLRQAALIKMAKGVTTAAEVAKGTSSDTDD